MTKFSPNVVDKLLHGLTHDDNFRAAFEQDPRAALSSIGHDTPAEHVGVEGKDPVLPFMTLQGGLASKSKLAASKDQMASEYRDAAQVGGVLLPFGPFSICDGSPQ
jgi:putative modified peptide